jgi:voltage-gated potassium channel
MRSTRNLRFSLLVLTVTIALGTIGYVLIEGWPVLDALYMTVITVSTVGFKEVNSLSDGGRIFTMLVIIFGAGTIAFTIGSLAQTMVEGQLLRILGRKKLEKKISKMQGHFIICGYGRIGAFISKELSGRIPFVVVENSPEVCQQLEEIDIPFVLGDATEDETLIEAGIQRAKGLITAVTSETANVYITLTARGLNPDLFILARCGEEGTEVKLKRAGANKVISPYQIGAYRMAWAVLRPSVVDFIDIAVGGENLELQLEEILVAPGSSLVGKTLVSSGIRRDWGVMIIGIKKVSGKMHFNPASTTPIEANDILITLGEQPAIQKLEIFAAGGAEHD